MGTVYIGSTARSHTMLGRTLVLSLLLKYGLASSLQTNAIYLSDTFDYNDIEKEIHTIIDAGYNRILVGWFVSSFGCTAACQYFVALPQATKDDVFNTAHAAGVHIYLGAGGPTQNVDYIINYGIGQEYATEISSFAVNNGFDGIDFSLDVASYVGSPSANSLNGKVVELAQQLVGTARQAGVNQLTLSGQAPYFSVPFMQGKDDCALSWLARPENANETWYVSEISLRMFNELSNYLTYEEIFTDNTLVDPIYGNFGAGSTVLDMINLGISADNILIVKPVTSTVIYLTDGFVEPTTLGSWICQFQEEYEGSGGVSDYELGSGSIYWNAGVVAYEYTNTDQTSVMNWPDLVEGQC